MSCFKHMEIDLRKNSKYLNFSLPKFPNLGMKSGINFILTQFLTLSMPAVTLSVVKLLHLGTSSCFQTYVIKINLYYFDTMKFVFMGFFSLQTKLHWWLMTFSPVLQFFSFHLLQIKLLCNTKMSDCPGVT